jgi:transposase
MIQITAQMRVLVAVELVDGRKGIDSLARLCQEKLAEDPFSGCVFVFRSRSGTAIRLLSYDGQGSWAGLERQKGRVGRGSREALAGWGDSLSWRPRLRAAPLERRRAGLHRLPDSAHAAARRRRSELLGGAEGAASIETADQSCAARRCAIQSG